MAWILLAAHLAITGLLWGSLLTPLGVALAWLLAWVAVDGEPSPPTSPKHADVRAFMQTSLGRALSHRRFWVPARPGPGARVALGLLLLGPGLAAGRWTLPEHAEALDVARHLLACAWIAPPLVLAAGFLAEMILLEPMLFPFLVLGPLAFGAAALASRDYARADRIAAVVVGFVAVLWAVDLGRALERARKG